MKYLLLCSLLSFLSFSSFGQTYIGGEITGKVVLTAADNPVLDTSDIVIDYGASLIIMPGVLFKFDQYYTHNGTGHITVYGTFRALGTKDSMITFTTNAFVPSAGPWESIYFAYPCSNYDSKQDTGCEIKYSNLNYALGQTIGVGSGGSNCSICDSSATVLIDHDSLGEAGIGIENPGYINPGPDKKVIISNNITAKYRTGLNMVDDDSSIVSGNLFDLGSFGDVQSILITGNKKCEVKNNIFLTPVMILDSVWFHNNYVEKAYEPFAFPTAILEVKNSFITNNTFVNTNTSAMCVFGDSLGSFTHNNIRWDTMYGNEIASLNEIFGTGLVRTSFSLPKIDARYNYVYGNAISDTLSIDSTLYDYLKDTDLIKINVHPLSLTPDTSAPMLPLTNVLKADDGNGNTEVSWVPSIEPDVAGYKIYYGHSNGISFQYSADVGNVNSYLLSSVPAGDTIAVTAYDHEFNNLSAGNDNQFTGHESWFTVAKSTNLLGVRRIPPAPVLIYPNPFNNHFYVYSPSQDLTEATLTIYNELGQAVVSIGRLNGKLFLVNENNLPPGIYYYKIQQGNKAVAKGVLEKD